MDFNATFTGKYHNNQVKTLIKSCSKKLYYFSFINFSDSLITDWLQHIKDVNEEQELIITNGSKFFIPFMGKFS